MASAAVEEIKSDEKMMIIDSVSSSLLTIEKSASRSKTESDEKKMMKTDSSRLSLASAEKTMTMTKRSETESGCRRSWSDLPIDMVKVILCELPSLYDRIHARAVCKNWLLPLNEIPTSSKLPWLLLFKWDDDTNDIQANLSRCRLVDPLYKEQKSSYFQQLENISNKRKRKRPKSYDQMMYRGTKVCASKNGWVMFYNLSSNKRVCRASREPKFDQKTSFFLYNPFTKHTITLPDLITPSYIEFCPSFDIATFSSSPDEDDCVFLVVSRDLFNQNQNFFATYRCRSSIMGQQQQQQKWKIDQFKVENRNGMSKYDEIEGSVYTDGIFYCVSYHGTLMSFNVALHEWTNLTALCPIPNDEYDYVYLVELNGELLVVCDEGLVKRLYVFDKSSKAWVRRENRYLKTDTQFFLGSYGSFAFSVDGADVDQNEIANYVFYCEERHKTLYYSIVSKSDNWEENLKELYCAQLWKSVSTKIWIQPPSKF